MRTEGLGHLKICKDFIGNRTRYIPSCSSVSQPTARPPSKRRSLLKLVPRLVLLVIRLPLAAEILGIQSGAVRGFCPSTAVFPSHCHSTNDPLSSSSTCCSYQTDKRAKHWNLRESNALTNIGEPVNLKVLCFSARSQNCEKRLLAPSCPSVRPFVSTHGTTRLSHWTDFD